MFRFALIALLALSCARAADSATIPDTPVGKVFAAWLETTNSGDRAQIQAFKDRYQSRPSVEQVLANRQQSGGYDLVRIEESTERRMSALLKQRANGQPLNVAMSISATDPPELEATRLTPVASGPALPPPISPTMTADAMSVALDRYLAGLAASGDFSGTVLVAKSGKALFKQGYGYANLESKRPNTVETRFNIGSINKMFTKVAIGQLLAQGKLKLTDTIGELLPDYPNEQARAATVDQLLNHTAGIANFFGPKWAAVDKSKLRSNDDFYRYVASQPLTGVPGARYEYCNGCYIVLGAIVARVSGVPYETYMAANVFKPAGMTGAAFVGAGDDRVATGYTRASEGAPLKDNRDTLPAHGSGAGGSYACVEDLLAFDNAVREFRLLDRKMTAWYFDATPDSTATVARAGKRNAIAGGAPGINAEVAGDTTWTIVVAGNWDMPNAQRVADAIAAQLLP